MRKTLRKCLSVLLAVVCLLGSFGAAHAEAKTPACDPYAVCSGTDASATEPVTEPEPEPETLPEAPPFSEPEDEPQSFRDRFRDFWLETADALEEGFANMFEAIRFLPKQLVCGAGWLVFSIVFPFVFLFELIKSAF